MNAAELLKVLEGVPDEALPKLQLRAFTDAMVSWLGEIELRAPDGDDNTWDVRQYGRTLGSGFTRLEALAAACRAVASTNALAPKETQHG